MQENILKQTRRRFGLAASAALVAIAAWMFWPGLPVIWEPRADPETKAMGLTLFEHEWQPHDAMASGDGLGPVFNARSCVDCHSQGGVGGGGDISHNVRAFEAAPTKEKPEPESGLVHHFAVENRFLEGRGELRVLFPLVTRVATVSGGCGYFSTFRRNFDPVRTESVNSTALFGAGWIDRIAPAAISHQSLKVSMARVGRELSSNFSGVVPGRYRVLPDGRVGKFGWKAQFATLEEFVAAACANEIGLGNPRRNQAKPLGFKTYPQVAPDLDSRQFNALVAFVDTLPRPTERTPDSPSLAHRAEAGKALFNSIGCAVCHTPNMGGVEGVYSDFLLHRLDDRSKAISSSYTLDAPEVPLPAEYPKPEEWKTPALWGVADSAPYFHDGSINTLEQAILHHKGDAEDVTKEYSSLSQNDRDALIVFLKTLRAGRCKTGRSRKPGRSGHEGPLIRHRPTGWKALIAKAPGLFGSPGAFSCAASP